MIHYCKATTDDLEFLVELRLKDLKMFSDKTIQQDTIMAIQQFYEMGIKNHTCITLLGYDDNRFIASASLYKYTVMPSNENPRGIVGQFTNVWVDDDYRHQGIATSMLQQLINDSNEVGMFCLNSSIEAMALYKQLGFQQKENYFVMYTE